MKNIESKIDNLRNAKTGGEARSIIVSIIEELRDDSVGDILSDGSVEATIANFLTAITDSSLPIQAFFSNVTHDAYADPNSGS